MVLRQHTLHREITRWRSAIIDRLVAVLGIGAVFIAGTIRWEPLAWAAGAVALGGMVLLTAVLFARSDRPAHRLRDLIRAWRNPVATTHPKPRRRNPQRRT